MNKQDTRDGRHGNPLTGTLSGTSNPAAVRVSKVPAPVKGVPTERLIEAQRMRDRGMFYSDIGEVLGVAGITVTYWLDPAVRTKRKTSGKEWYATNSEHAKPQQKTYKATHRKQTKATDRTYRKQHRAKRTAVNAARRARITGNTIGDRKEIAAIYSTAQDAPRVRCYICGNLIPKGKRQVDHIIPISKGGAHTPSNLAVACEHCNETKAAKLPSEIGLLI